MGLEFVFLSARCTVRQEMLPTMLSSTSLSASNSSVQRLRPFGGWLQARAIKRASFSPSRIGSMGGRSRFFRSRAASSPWSTKRLRLPSRSASVARKRWGDGFVAPARAIRVGLHQNVCVSDPVGCVRPLLRRTMYFLLGIADPPPTANGSGR